MNEVQFLRKRLAAYECLISRIADFWGVGATEFDKRFSNVSEHLYRLESEYEELANRDLITAAMDDEAEQEDEF